MPAQRLECPECDSVIRSARRVEPGKRIRCPRCEAVFRVPDSEDEEPVRRREKPNSEVEEPVIQRREKPAPRRRRTKKATSRGGGNAKLYLILGIGGTAIAIGVILFLTLDGGSGGSGLLGGSKAVTRENLGKIYGAMAMKDAEKLFGTPASTTKEKIKERLTVGGPPGAFSSGGPEQSFFRTASASQASKWYEWNNGDSFIVVGTRNDREGVERIVCSAWAKRTKEGGGVSVEYYPGATVIGNSDLAGIARKREEFENLLNDPKWKKGDALKKALVGKWIRKRFQEKIEFFANGTYEESTPFRKPFRGTWNLVEGNTVDLTRPGSTLLPPRPEDSTRRYQILVSEDEMYRMLPGATSLGTAYARDGR